MQLAPSLAVLTLFATPATAQVLVEVHGTPADNLGASVAGLGDVNGDGVDDFLAAAPSWEGAFAEGRVRLYSGADGSVIRGHVGDYNSGFAWGADALGDLDGDGLSEYIIGDWLDDTVGNNAGFIRVYSGASGAVLFELFGPVPDGVFGYTVSRAGDLNGDGTLDFAVGAPNEDLVIANEGTLYTYSGLDASPLWQVGGDFQGAAMGRVVAPLGDVNGDGHDDLVVGLERTEVQGDLVGGVRVLSGLDGSVLRQHFGEAHNDYFGRYVAGPGDVDGDGLPDVVVGAPGHDSAGDLAGRVQVFSGATGALVLQLDGWGYKEAFGSCVSAVGDLDGDGHADIAAGSDFSDHFAYFGGHVRVHSGATGELLRLYPGYSPQGYQGRAMALAGDMDGDGVQDLLVSAPGENQDPWPGAGAVRIFAGGVAPPASFCYGDGGCPCGNTDPEAGCANSTGAGASLLGSGSPSLSADESTFLVRGLPAGTFGILVMGDSSSAGAPLADGRLCLGGALQRFPVAGAGPEGRFVYGPTLPASITVTAGMATYFQAWYRDTAGPCGGGSNLSNGVQLTWLP